MMSDKFFRRIIKLWKYDGDDELRRLMFIQFNSDYATYIRNEGREKQLLEDIMLYQEILPPGQILEKLVISFSEFGFVKIMVVDNWPWQRKIVIYQIEFWQPPSPKA
jgi:hypothetical protein